MWIVAPVVMLMVWLGASSSVNCLSSTAIATTASWEEQRRGGGRGELEERERNLLAAGFASSDWDDPQRGHPPCLPPPPTNAFLSPTHTQTHATGTNTPYSPFPSFPSTLNHNGASAHTQTQGNSTTARPPISAPASGQNRASRENTAASCQHGRLPWKRVCTL